MANTTIYPYGTNGQLPSSIGVINDLTTGGADKALSAEMGKVLKGLIDNIGTGRFSIVDEHDNNSVLLAPSARQMKLMYNNIMAIYNGLANIAFTNGKPTLDWVGAKTKYTLAYGSLNGCTADVAAGQVNEGALRIKLTPTQASYAFTSVTVNGQSAQTTATGDADGSVYLDIIVNGNITVAATAISGRGIDFTGSTGCSIGAAGVAFNQDLDTTITANEHFTLPASITVKIGNANVTHTYTRAQDNKTATLHIDAANITGDLTITCTADEDAHAVLNLTNVGSGVNVNKANNAHVYVGDTISILPASGNKVTASATIGGNAATLTGDTYDGYSYTIGSGDVSINGTAIAITATADALDTFSIDLTGVTSDVGVTWTNPSAEAQTILEGSPFKITLAKVSGTGTLQIGTCTMAGGTLTPNNGVIETDHVAGNITIAASVEEVITPELVHSYKCYSRRSGNSVSNDTTYGGYIPDETNSLNLYTSARGGGFANIGTNPTRYGNGRLRGDTNDWQLPKNGNWSIVVKNYYPAEASNHVKYGGSSQLYMMFADNVSEINAYSWPYTSALGQFILSLETLQTGGGTVFPKILYMGTGGQTSAWVCENSDSSGQFFYGSARTLVYTYNDNTKTLTMHLVNKNSNNELVHKTHSIQLNTNLVINGFSMNATSSQTSHNDFTFDSLNFYNYVLSDNEIEGFVDN